MKAYKTKVNKFPGTHWWQVSKNASSLYKEISKKTKRRPYIRSAYFQKDKIFLGLFWQHLHEKTNIRDKTRRLKYLPCALELIRNSHNEPVSKENPNKEGEILHRFTGITPDNSVFLVQIKEVKRNSQKWLISVFPLN